MSSFRKFTAALSALAVTATSVFTFSVAVAATTFTDASSISSWASSSVTSLADSGVLSGRPDGSFDPKGQLNRAEVAKVAVLAAGLTTDTTGAPHFNDVASGDWFYSYVETLYNNGVVGGINGGALDSNGLATYNPGGTLNRAEGSKILVDAFDLETAYAGTPPNFPDVASSAWFYDYVETAYAHGIINGYDNGNFGPGDAITREQIAVIAKSGVDEVASSSKRRSDYTAGAASSVEPTTPVTPTTSNGSLTVAVSASTPAAQTFPKGAASTAVAAYDFTASSDDVVVTNLVVKRTGVGVDSDWTLYLYDGNNRLTSGKTVNSTTHEATFTGVNVSVAAGTTKTLTLKADTSTSSTGGDSYFEIASASAVTSNAKSVGGSFPVKSNKNEVNTSVSAGTIIVEKSGSITNPEVGADNVTISKFKITTSNEAGLIKQIAVIVDGTVSAGDVQNAKLYQGDTLLASTAGVNSKDLLVFTLSTPYTIEKGDSRIFEIRADLNTGRSADTLKIYADESTDIVAVGGTYGFGMSVDITDDSTGAGFDNGDNDGTDASHSTLQGGDITISSSGPAAGDIAVNSDDVTLLNFSIASVSEATFKSFGIILTTNDTTVDADAGGLLNDATANYTDIKIINRDTGAVVMGPIDSTAMHTATGGTTLINATAGADNDNDGWYTFTDEFTMAAGEELNLALTCDIANNTGADFVDDTVYASLDLDNTSVLVIKDVNNKTVTNSTTVVPSSDITGKTMSIKSPSLTISLASTPVSDTFVKGTQDVCFAAFSLAAGDASDIKITEFKVDGGSDADGSGWTQAATGVDDIVGSVELYEGDTKIGSAEGVQTDGTATFDNLSYVIGAGETKLVKVCGDITSNIASGNRGVAFAIAAASNITAEDEDGNSVDPSGTASQVATTPDVIMTISQGGSLTIAVDANTPKENIVVAGTSDVAISKFKFTTTDEAFTVRKLSINNRQSAATTAAMGDYDNNVTAIKLSYTNSSGATETKTGYLTNGTANFSGMDMYIDKDDDAVLTVSANINTIASGALAGEYIDLNLAFNDFEAIAEGSGETYDGSKIDYTTDTASDLDFGTITYVDSSATICVNAAADATVTAGSAISFYTNACAATTPINLPVGTILCHSTGTSCDESSEDIFVVTGWTEGAAWTENSAAGDLVAAVALNDEDGTLSNNDTIIYALPGTGYLTDANRMHVLETKPTVALSSSSPSGSRTVSSSDNAFIFTISADSHEKVQIRTALELVTCLAGNSTVTVENAADTTAAEQVDGSGCNVDAVAGADDFVAYSAPLLETYAYASFWIRWTASDAADDATLDVTEIEIGVNTDNTGAVEHVTAVAATNIVGSPSVLVEDTWYQVYDVAIPSAATTTDEFFDIQFAGADDSGPDNANDDVFLDRVVLYNDKISVDLASDADFDRDLDGDSNHEDEVPLVAYLKEGGTTVATGYVDFDSGADVATADASAAHIEFYPISGTNSAIEISKGTSKTFTVQLNTSSLLHEDAGSDDPLTFSIDLGSSSDGSVTAGDIWWNDTNFADQTNGGGATAYSLANADTGIIRWLGQVDSTTLYGNTLKY